MPRGIYNRQPRGTPRATSARFKDHKVPNPTTVRSLKPDSRAMVNMATMFPTKVQPAPEPGTWVLKSGFNQRKLGDRITKGPWAGSPIWALTLEERATCPATCHNLSTCYGNGMPMSKRYPAGAALEERLADNLEALQEKHPGGFAVRLHILGDFYSMQYIGLWRDFLERFPALRVFGFTAWPQDHRFGRTIQQLNLDFPERWVLRFSTKTPGPMTAVTIDRIPDTAVVAEGQVCPAQMRQDVMCGSCGLCWSPAMRGKSIAFIRHGNPGRGRSAHLKVVQPPSPAKIALVAAPSPGVPGIVRALMQEIENLEASLKADPRTRKLQAIRDVLEIYGRYP